MESVGDILTRHLESAKSKIQQRMASEKRNASGRTSSSLMVEVNGEKGILWGGGGILYVEKGRGPGKVPKTFVETIKDWIKAKGISVRPKPSTRQSKYTPEERGLNSLAGAIAYNIMKNGTKLYRNRAMDDIYTSVIEEEMELLGKEIALGIGTEIHTINNRIR